MGNKLKGRTICPRCGKGFDNRVEGFKSMNGLVYCAKCYHETSIEENLNDNSLKSVANKYLRRK